MACKAIVTINGKERTFDVTDNHSLLDEFISNEYSGYLIEPAKNTDNINSKIKELEKEKLTLTSKALKQFPNSKIQLETIKRIDEINNELKQLEKEQTANVDVNAVDEKAAGKEEVKNLKNELAKKSKDIQSKINKLKEQKSKLETDKNNVNIIVDSTTNVKEATPDERLVFQQGTRGSSTVFLDAGVKKEYTSSIQVRENVKTGEKHHRIGDFQDAIRKLARIYVDETIDLRGKSIDEIIAISNSLDEDVEINKRLFKGERATITKALGGFGKNKTEYTGIVIYRGSQGIGIKTEEGKIIKGKNFKILPKENKDSKLSKDNTAKIAGIDSQITELERQLTSLVEEYDNKIKALQTPQKEPAGKESPKTQDNVQEKVQAEEEVENKEAKRKASNSLANQVAKPLKEFFNKLMGKSDLITVSTTKLDEIAKERGFLTFKEVKNEEGVVVLSTPTGKVYGLFLQNKDNPEDSKIYLADDFTTGTLIEEVKHFQYFLMKIAAGKGDAKAKKILTQAEKILKPIVDKVIAAQGKADTEISGDVRSNVEPTPFVTRDGKPIGFTYDTEQVARERFDFSKLKQIGKGSDRTVFDLGDGRALKVAHTARGLAQNIYEGDYYLKGTVPEVYERGLNYVVVDNVPKAKMSDKVTTYDWDGNEIGESTVGEMLKLFSVFRQDGFDKKVGELQDALAKYGFQDITSYDVMWGDFHALRNWGYKDGKAIHTDGGTFGGVENILTSYRGVKNLSDPEFREIYNKSKQVKKELGDTDKYTKFNVEGGTDNKALQQIKDDYGIDLTSSVYQQQKNESDESYRDRIFDEVWAKITAFVGVETIAKNPDLFNKIKNLLVEIQNWFLDKLGLTDGKLSKLSPYALGQQSFNSLMKGEFITSKPIVIEAEKNPVGGYKPAKNVQEIFDRLPEDVKEYFRAAEGWDEKKGVNNIPQRLLKILDDDKVATSTKLAMLGKATSLFKKPWNSDMKKEVVEAFLSNTTTLDEFLEAADEILNSDNYKDLSNVSLNVRTVRGDMIVLEQLYKYFRDNVTNESEDILTKVSLLYAEITSLSGITLNMASPSMSMEDLVGSFTILSHAALTKMFNTSVDGNTLKSQIDELQKRLKLKSDYIETLTTKIKELTVNSKKTPKVEVIASGFVGGNKAVEKANKNLINIVSGLKGSTQVPRASASLRFSAEPINEVEVALANLLLTNYINKKGDLLQAKLALQAQLEALKNVEGENVYEMMVAKLPAGYAILEKLDTGETKSDLIKSSVFKEMRAKANREAALNTFTNRLVGTDKIKNIAQRVKNLDFVDSFVKHLAARVLKRAAINITDAVMGIDTTILKNPAAVNEGAEYKIIRRYYKQVEEIKNNLDNSLVDNIEAEKQLKEINKKMKQELSKYSSFKDRYPLFEFNYQDTPVTGSIIMDDKKTYMYDSKEGVWRDQKDMRPVSDITNDRLTKSYSSKLFTENYLKSTAKALGNYLTDNTNVASIMKDAYNSFKEGKHDIKTIRKIEDMIYAAYNVDVTGYVALRHMIEDDSVLRDKTLTELLQNVYSKQATADLATELTNRLGIDEYDSMKAADAIKNFISDEISPKLEEELKDFLNNDTKLIREAMRLAIDGKISAMDLLPVVAKKFNLRGWDEGSVHEFETLVEAVKNKNATPLERKKALLELRQFFIDHKNEPLIKYVADGLVSMTYNDLFSIRTFFTAMGSMANTMWSTFQFMVKEFGDVVYTNIFTPDDSNKITFREYGVLVSEVTAGAFTEMMRKGFTESIRALVTGKGSDIFMAEDARLRSNTWYNKAFTDKFNKLTTSTYNSIKSKLIGKYKELNPIITTKNGELVFTEFHPLFNFKELLGIAIRDGVKNPFITVAESLEAKIFDYENIGRELYLKERDKYNEAKRAAAWLRANQDSFVSGTLPSTYDVTKSAGKDIANIGAWIMGSTVALGYRSMVLPVIGDALVSTPATYANVAINTYLEMKGKDRVSGDMARTLRTALGFSEKTEEDLKAAFGKPPSLLKMATMMLTHPVDTHTNYTEKTVEIIESNRNQDVWDEARRPVAEATAVAAPRGVAGVIANSISHWFHGIVINQALAVTPDSNKFARIAKPIGATLAMLIERAIFPFVFKVGTNAFNINVRQLPGGYYIMKGITKGFAHFTKDNINNEDWHKGRDGNYHNGKWSIVPSDGLYKLYKTTKNTFSNYQQLIGDAMTLDEAKAKAFNSNSMVSRGFVDLINPDKNFVGKYTRKGLQIEEMYDLNEVEKTTLASSSLLSLSMLAYALFSMYDWDEDEDGKWKLIRDPDAKIVINGHMTNSYYKDKSSANGIAPMSLQWKDNNGKYHTILSLENIMIRGLFYAIIGIDDYVRNDEMRTGDEYTAINTGESKLDVALKVANAMVTGAIKLAMNEVLSRNFGESAGWLVDGIRFKSFKNQRDLQDQEKGYYNMIRPFKQMGLGMLGANANRKYISSMSSVGVEDRYKATDRTFQPIADIMYSDYNLPSWGLRKLGVISKEASEQLLANLMFSDYGRYIGEPIFGIKGSFEDNFTKVYHSPRGTRLSQEFVPTGAFRVKNYEATIGDKSDFDKWGEANGIGASYKFMEPNTFITNITTPEQNIKLQKEVENSAPIIAEQLFKNNIGEFNKMINKVEDKVKTIDGIYMGDNTYEKYKLKQKFNETILNKSYEIAVVLGVRKMIKDNPKNIELINFNNNNNKTLKNIKNTERIDFYKDGTFTLDIVSSTSDPKFTSEEFKIIPSISSPYYTYDLEMAMDFTIDPNKLGELDRNQMQGLLEEKPRVYNITMEKLGDLLTAKTIYKVNDRKYNIGVILNSNNELIPVTDIYKELVKEAEVKQHKR